MGERVDMGRLAELESIAESPDCLMSDRLECALQVIAGLRARIAELDPDGDNSIHGDNLIPSADVTVDWSENSAGWNVRLVHTPTGLFAVADSSGHPSRKDALHAARKYLAMQVFAHQQEPDPLPLDLADVQVSSSWFGIGNGPSGDYTVRLIHRPTGIEAVATARVETRQAAYDEALRRLTRKVHDHG